MKYSIVLPIYNEESNIRLIYKSLTKVLKSLKGTFEIIFVNDGSTDKTAIILQQLHKKDKHVKIINFSRNFGHQVAVSAGLSFTKGEFIAVLDADMQDPPEILPQFFEKLKEGYDTVYAIRTKRKESYVMRIVYSLFYHLLQSISDIYIPLDSGDFCVMNRKVVSAINKMPERNRFVRGLRSWVGFKQLGIEYERSSRYSGLSKYNFTKLFKLACDGIFSFSYVPLQLMLFIGLISIIASGFVTIWVFYQKFFTSSYDTVPGFATTVILVTFIGGLQLFSLGIAGEYLRRMYDEIKQRPYYIIDTTIGFK